MVRLKGLDYSLVNARTPPVSLLSMIVAFLGRLHLFSFKIKKSENQISAEKKLIILEARNQYLVLGPKCGPELKSKGF